MIVSEARISANRRNSLKSTGPRTLEGKARSRANALKHGLCASIVVPESAELVQARSSQWYFALKPQNPHQGWLVDQVAILSLRIDRCERTERRERDKVCLRAELTWDDDRRLEAEVLGGLLARKPAETVETLRRTPQGCEWLMTRWAMLAYAADTSQGAGWTADQTALAFDLLATPATFREGRKPGASIDFEGNLIDSDADPAIVARREIAALKERRAIVEGLDEVERALASADLSTDKDPELRRLRRYESALHTRLRWCLAQIHYKSPYEREHPGLRPGWIDQPRPASKPEPLSKDEVAAKGHPAGSLVPPFDLEPDEYPEPGQVADIPKILASRREKKVAKAESRREARRRKLEKLRA